jgi:predicted nucleotidyltransferase
VFTPEDRIRLRNTLITAASVDPRISAAALTGSAAVGAEDAWSDIDLALSIAAGADSGDVIAAWTERMYREGGAIHHLDVYLDEILFRVFLLSNTLQVDLAFWPEAKFGAIGRTFQLLFGTANSLTHLPPPHSAGLIGYGWLYALHARSSIERGRAWQAEYMISAMRDQVLALACLRHDLPTVEGRGIDRLPPEVLAAVTEGLVRGLDRAELRRAFRVVTEALIVEVKWADRGLADRLDAVLWGLTGESPRDVPPDHAQ